jgi:hypothetical protein
MALQARTVFLEPQGPRETQGRTVYPVLLALLGLLGLRVVLLGRRATRVILAPLASRVTLAPLDRLEPMVSMVTWAFLAPLARLEHRVFLVLLV